MKHITMDTVKLLGARRKAQFHWRVRIARWRLAGWLEAFAVRLGDGHNRPCEAYDCPCYSARREQ